jgi:hypothetical protein
MVMQSRCTLNIIGGIIIIEFKCSDKYWKMIMKARSDVYNEIWDATNWILIKDIKLYWFKIIIIIRKYTLHIRVDWTLFFFSN